MANATLDDQIEDLDLNDDGSSVDDPTDGEDRGNDYTPEEKPADPAAEEPQEEDDGRKNGSRMVPITRFNEVNERMKELAAQNQQLLDAITRGTPQAQQPETAAQQEAPVDLKDLRTRHYAALTEGRDDEAIELQGQIDAVIEERAMQRAMAKMTESQAQREQAMQMQTFQQVVQQIEKDYPQLNAKSDQANDDAILYVVAKRDALIRAGESMSDALRKASDAAAQMFGFGEQPSHIEKPTLENRKQEALLRNARAAQAQPPQPSGLGNRATAPQRVDVSTMSESEFDALPEAEKARLRGD